MELSNIALGLERENKNEIPEKLKCEYATLTNLDNNYVYKDYSIKDNKLLFDNIRGGQYVLNVKLEGYVNYTEEVDCQFDSLMISNNSKIKDPKILEFVKYKNPEWGEWSEWSKWQNKRIERNSKTDVEVRMFNSDKINIKGTMHTRQEDPAKPIYEKRQVLVGTRLEKNEKGELHKVNVYGTVNVITGYEYKNKDYNVYIGEDLKTNVRYRYRTRKLTGGTAEYIYVTEDSKEILLDMGYELMSDSVY